MESGSRVREAYFAASNSERKKVSKKPAPKEIVAGPPLLVRQQCSHSVGGSLVISVYDCFKGAADRPHLVACKQASK